MRNRGLGGGATALELTVAAGLLLAPGCGMQHQWPDEPELSEVGIGRHIYDHADRYIELVRKLRDAKSVARSLGKCDQHKGCHIHTIRRLWNYLGLTEQETP